MKPGVLIRHFLLCASFLIAWSASAQLQAPLQLKFTSGVRAILEDSRGNIWFGSHNEGLCMYNGSKLKYFTVYDGMSHNQVRSIFEDESGTVWFECAEGFTYFNGFMPMTWLKKKYDSKDQWKLTANDLWFKGNESNNYNAEEGGFGVYRFDGETMNFQKFPKGFVTNTEASYAVSTPTIKGKGGRVWIGTYMAVLGYDGESFTMINNELLGLDEEKGYLHVRSIYEDSMGRLWIGNNGIGVLLHHEDSTFNFSEQQGLISRNSTRQGGYHSPPHSLEHVFAIGEDTNGNIWFGDRDTGIWRYDGKTMKNFGEQEGLRTTHVWQIYQSKSGDMWFAMGDGSVLKFNGKFFERIF